VNKSNLCTLLDVETTGLNPDTDEVCEVAAILYDYSSKTILQQCSTLLPVKSNLAADINKISVEDTLKIKGIEHYAVETIEIMMESSRYAVAFNSDFDHSFFKISSHLTDKAYLPWSDAACIRYPKPSHSRSLVNLCLAHGIPVVSVHRALTDCQLLAQLLGTVDDLAGELERCAQPKVLAKALVSYDDREKAKAAGFHWDKPDLIRKAWAKRCLPSELEILDFEVEIIDG
jgi:DNA polymerase-3 subunit epsilon